MVVTGASGGLGKIIAAELVRAGASVALAVCEVARGRAAAATMSGRTEVRPLDLASLALVRAFAAAWNGDLDVLVNNAGIMRVPHGVTQDGFELQMGTNYLGPFTLTSLLLPRLRGRVVTVSSQLQSGGHIHPDDLNGERRPYNTLQAYRDFKLANTLFNVELSGRLARAGSPVRAMTADPGWARPAWPRTSAARRASSRHWPCACSTTLPAAPCQPSTPRPLTSLPAPMSHPTASGTCADTPR